MAQNFYTAVVWGRSTGPTDIPIQLAVIDNNNVVLGSRTEVVSQSWTPIRVIFRTNEDSTSVRLNIAKPSGPSVDVDFTGYGIYEGRHPEATFNSGSANDPSEDITEYVLAVKGDAGSNTDPTRLTPIDGELSVTLTNVGREFTPRNTESPFYNKIRKHALVEVQAEVEHNRWEAIWTGMYDRLELDAGTNGPRQATLTALHGLIHMDDQTLVYTPKTNQKTSDMLKDVLEGQRLPAKRWAWTPGTSRWGLNTFIADPAQYADIDETSFVHSIAGAGWSAGMTVRKALDSLVVNEQGYALLDRDGRYIFRARNRLIPDAEVLNSEHILVDLEVQDARYEYRGIRATEVEVTYAPRQAYSGIIWETKSENPIKISTLGEAEIMITPETPEGFPVTVFSFQPLKSIHDNPTSSWFRAYNSVNPRMEHFVRHTITNEGQRLRLHLVNTSTDIPDLHIEAAIYGTGYMTKDKQTLVVRDETNLQMNDGHAVTLRLNLDLVADEIEARSIANQILHVMRDMADGIFELTYHFGSGLRDRERLKKALSVKPGNVVRLTEHQTAINDLPHLVIGERFEWTPGGITLTQTILPIRPTEVWRLDVSEWGISTKVGY